MSSKGGAALMPRISDLKSLREHLSEDALLVAFDTESYGYLKNNGGSRPSNKVSELGFAALEWPCPELELWISSKDFADWNNAKLLTIQLRERTCKHIESTSAPIVRADSIEEVQETFYRFLPAHRRTILVGYALSMELRWIAKECPLLAKFFLAYVDVQEMVMQKFMGDELISTDNSGSKISLKASLYGLNFTRSPNDSKAHRAVNDACRILQVLSSLLVSRPFVAPSSSQRSPLLQPILRDKNRFSVTLCINTSAGNNLPRRNPREIARMYQVFEPIAVGVYSHRRNGETKNARYWWLAFQNRGALAKCMAEVCGSFVEGSTLYAIEECGLEREQLIKRDDIRQKGKEARLKPINAFEVADVFGLNT